MEQDAESTQCTLVLVVLKLGNYGLHFIRTLWPASYSVPDCAGQSAGEVAKAQICNPCSASDLQSGLLGVELSGALHVARTMQ